MHTSDPNGQHDPSGPSSGPSNTAGPSAPVSQPPAAWAWAQQPRMVPQYVETEPLPYHRLFRGALKYAWWKPLVVLVLAGIFYVVLSLVLTLVMMPLFMAYDPEYLNSAAMGEVILDTQRPLSLLYGLVSITLMLPSVLLAMLIMGIRPTGRMWSVATRIRWGLLGRVALIAVLGVFVMNVVGIAAEFALNPALLTESADAEPAAALDWNAVALSLVLVVLLVPLQATAEEVVFRGLFMQIIGSWLKNPWFAILIPTLLFAAAHIYDIWGLLMVGLMGLAAGWLTWRTGGLEAAIAIHVINNLVAFGFMALGAGGSTSQDADAGSLGGVIGEVAGLALFTWLVVRMFVKRGYGRERIDYVVRMVPVAPAPPAPPQQPQAPGAVGV